jgi:hypothetical protein
MASTGQSLAQTPQPAHLAASIQRFPFFSEIASVGQFPSQAPQLVQVESLIL